MKRKQAVIGLLLSGLCCFAITGKSLINKGVSAYCEETAYVAQTDKQEELSVQAKSAYLMDFSTQTPRRAPE